LSTFFADWCGPCKFIAPKVQEFARTYSNAKFYKVDVDELPAVAAEIGIKAMPTLIFYKDGKKVDEVIGANTSVIESTIKKYY